MEAKFIFKDGTEIVAEDRSGSYAIAEKPVFPEDLTGMKIIDQFGERTLEYPIFVECAPIEGKYWFNFIEESIQDRTFRELKEENSMLEDAIIELAGLIGE